MRLGARFRRELLDATRDVAPVLRDALSPAAIGARVRTLRLERGWTLDDLADRLDSYRPIVGRLERGRHTPSPLTLVRYAAALEVSVGELLGGA